MRQGRGVGAPSHGHVGFTAAFAAHLLRHKIHELAGFDLAHAVGRHACSQLHFAALHRGQHDGRRLELVFELVQGLAQRLGVGPVQACGQHLESLHIHRLREQLIALGRCELALECGDVFLQHLHLLQHRHHASRHIGRGDLERLGHATQCGFKLLQIGQRMPARDGLHATNPRGHAALGNDFEDANVPRALHMSTSAKFSRGPDVQHPHFIAVLLAKQHHGAKLLRLINGQHPGLGGRVGQDLGIDDRLDLRHLRLGDGGVV